MPPLSPTIAPPLLANAVGAALALASLRVPAPRHGALRARPRAVDRRVVPRDEEPLEHDDGEVQQEAEPDDEQRDQGDLGHDLRGHDHGAHRLLEPDDPSEHRAEDETQGQGDRESHQRLRQRDPNIGPEPVGVDEVAHALEDVLGLREDERGDVEHRDDELPDDHHHDDRHDRADPRQELANPPAHSLTPPCRSRRSSSSVSWRRSSRTFSWKPGSAVTSSERGCGTSTWVIERMRPGRADRSTTRSARNTASAIEWVTNTTVAFVACAM